MEKIDLLYDHYKETMQLSLNMQKKRGTLLLPPNRGNFAGV